MNGNKKFSKGKKNNNYRGGKRTNRGNKSEQDKRYNAEDAKLEAEGRDNDPNWYFLDKQQAEQVSQLAFQEIADTDLRYNSVVRNLSPLPFVTYNKRNLNAASMCVLYLNPSPGVQLDAAFNNPSSQRSAINLAGFRLRSKIAAFTGRVTPYSSHDISVMILYMGEIISLMEWIRRAFGVSYTLNMYSRVFPKRILEAMHIDADDMFKNYSSYRTRFNACVTRLNQIPIPKDIKYFDKCASLYEHIYADSDSPMAQIIVTNPATSWNLDEQSNPQGTVLATAGFLCAHTSGQPNPIHNLDVFLGVMENKIDALMNSSTFETVYTDLLNLATKMKLDFWKFDYLAEGYTVMPEYNANFLLQLHNMTTMGVPNGTVFPSATLGVTPWNDVLPNAAGNATFYNPMFKGDNGTPNQSWPNWGPIVPGPDVVVDSPTPLPGVEDRIEMLRFTSTISGNNYVDQGVLWFKDNVLPDHYLVGIRLYKSGSTPIYRTRLLLNSEESATDKELISYMSHIDWAPYIYGLNYNSSTVEFTDDFIGDQNFYTVVDASYLRKIVDFVGLGLYDLR